MSLGYFKLVLAVFHQVFYRYFVRHKKGTMTTYHDADFPRRRVFSREASFEEFSIVTLLSEKNRFNTPQSNAPFKYLKKKLVEKKLRQFYELKKSPIF